MKRLVLIGMVLGFPLLEAVVLVRLTQVWGWWVLVWVLVSACFGIALIKEARFALLARLAAGVAQGSFSISALTDSARFKLARNGIRRSEFLWRKRAGPTLYRQSWIRKPLAPSRR